MYTALLVQGAGEAVVWAHRTTSGYDRLGNIRAGEGEWYYRIAVYIARAGTFVIITAAFIAITITLVFTIRYFEMDYARQMNIDNKFADVDFSDALLWMFMFMGAGDPGDIFPLSTPGKILAAILPFLGITSMLGLLFMAVERRRQLGARRRRGTVTQDVRNHVLVCGWNEKVPGLVWALTNKEAPERKKVVIVAVLEGDMPLERYNFDPGLVSYCCGDSADHRTLDRAHIGKAEAAIVVAGLQKRKGRNIRSVLSVMALKEANKKARAFNGVGDSGFFVAAEMIYDENQALFEASQVDAVVHSEKIADRMAALGCTSPSVVDFVLDMFTYDEHAELYSIQVDSLQSRHLAIFCAKWFKWRSMRRVLFGGMAKRADDHGDKPALVGMRLADARSIFAANGVNVVGLVKASYNCTPNFVDHEFGEKSPYNLLLGADDGDLRIEIGDSLLYIADDYDDIYTAMLLWHGTRQELLPRLEVDDLWPPEDKRVLLVGDLERCLQARKLLENVS